MKNVFEAVIRKGGFDLATMLRRIDEYHVAGKLNDIERDQLIAEARGEAVPGLDVVNEIQRLWAAIHALEDMLGNRDGETENGDAPEVAEYIQPTGAHDAYYYGRLVTYNGKTYKCIAPEGMACVWSPDVMPGYWQVVSDDA